MKSQWECVLQNLGAWQGSFTRLSPMGETIEDIASLVTLTGVNENQTIHFVLNRYYPDPDGNLQPQDLVFDFSAPGNGAIFFETGAFSEGSISLQKGIAGGSEFAFLDKNRRFRLIQQFDRYGELERLTLIREQRVGTNLANRTTLDLKDWLGQWHGEAIVRYPRTDKINQVITTQNIVINADQSVTRSHQICAEIAASTFTIDVTGNLNRLTNQFTQVMLLPDGAYAIYPTKVAPGVAIELEVGWLIDVNIRQRLIRTYSDQGEWLSVAFITESRSG
jgi:Domain of unknown function (DUF3598)